MSSITCGHCRKTHSTVAEVRECSTAQVQATAYRDVISNSDQPTPARSSMALAMPDVPAGRYAIEWAPGHVMFYKVDRPTEGRWIGYTFVKVQASDDLHRVRDAASRLKILTAIAADPHSALVRYGHEIGKCGVCNRTLTNDQSREAGIGPVCAANL